MFGPHEAMAAGSPSRVTDARCCSRPLFILYSLRCCHNLIEVRLHGHFFKPFRYAIECADVNRTDSHTQCDGCECWWPKGTCCARSAPGHVCAAASMSPEGLPPPPPQGNEGHVKAGAAGAK